MCGLAGIFTPSDERLVDLEVLGRMTDAIAHRGPDDRQFHRQPHLGLGFRRLSILDLAGGRQPIFNEDRSVVMVCNGEIFNHHALREQLIARGHTFRANVDVEVLIHLYEDRGPDFLTQVNGQFALALYDSRSARLLLARDPVGIAPLFYTQRGDTLLFASEIKALLEHPLVERRVDLTGLDQMLTLPGMVSPRTMFAGVHSVPPGHFLAAREGRIERHAYWDLDYPAERDIDPAKEPVFDELAAHLRQAVADRLQADVPVGCYLSGGLDSSLIGALIREVDGVRDVRSRHAFSIGFTDSLIDERSYQRLMAQHMGALHHTTVFDESEIERRLRQAVCHAETPLKESYNTCSLALSASVRAQGLKVVLTGEGADELFGGYVGYRLDQQRQADTAEDFSLEVELERERRSQMWGDSSIFYEKNYGEFTEVKTALYAPAVAAQLESFDCTRETLVDGSKLRGRHPLHQRSYLDFKLRLADHLLADHGDRVGLANSVEARYPFLDPGVVDWTRHIHPAWLSHNGLEKYPLRRIAAETHVPREILSREKFAFVAPSCALLLQQKVPWAMDLLSHDRIKQAGYFNAGTVERLKTQYTQPGFRLNTTFDTDLLMIVLTFELLREIFSIPSLNH